MTYSKSDDAMSDILGILSGKETKPRESDTISDSIRKMETMIKQKQERR